MTCALAVIETKINFNRSFFQKGVKNIFLLKFSQTSFIAFQLGTEKSLDGIANYFIRFDICLKINEIRNIDKKRVVIWGKSDSKMEKDKIKEEGTRKGGTRRRRKGERMNKRSIKKWENEGKKRWGSSTKKERKGKEEMRRKNKGKGGGGGGGGGCVEWGSLRRKGREENERKGVEEERNWIPIGASNWIRWT